jgi:hypothetical protein
LLTTIRHKVALRRAAWHDSDRRSAWLRSRFAGAATTLLGARLLHCFGDSHAVVFREIARRGMLPHTWIDLAMIGGATALGLANPNSRTRALPQFEGAIRALPTDRHLLFMLGEVDCGFVIWHRAETRGIAVSRELDRSVRNYTRFLTRLLEDGRTRIVVAATPPPTILDGQDWGEVANLRREVKASLQDRTELTLEYNARLREWSAANGCVFLDYERDVLDPRTGVVAEAFRNPNPRDHHLAPAAFGTVIAGHLRTLGFD